MLLLTGVRTGELRLATSDQFDLDRGLWITYEIQVGNLLAIQWVTEDAVFRYGSLNCSNAS
jgi:integrase